MSTVSDETIPEGNLAESVRPAIATAAQAQCSFCDKPRSACARLISGRRGAFICDECVALCALLCNDDDSDNTPTAHRSNP